MGGNAFDAAEICKRYPFVTGCDRRIENFTPADIFNMVNQNMMNQNRQLTGKDFIGMEIEKIKKLIDDNLKMINFFRQNPVWGQNPQMFELITSPHRQQIMMHENRLKELYEKFNREGFSQLEPYSRNSDHRHPKNPITSAELANARKMWGDALVAIATAYDTSGLPAATEIANRVIDGAYGYNLGPVLFKPTLTSGDHTFRTTRDGALSYFVGQNPRFPTDTGFALKGWRKAENQTFAEFIDDDVAMWMGIVTLTDKNGNKTKVDKSWGYKKDPDGKLRLVLHHSSLPYRP